MAVAAAVVQVTSDGDRYQWRLLTAGSGRPVAVCGDYSHASITACRACATASIRLAHAARIRVRMVLPGRYGWLLVYGEMVLARSVHSYPDLTAARQDGQDARRDLRTAVLTT
ncbi:hypothetical protein [Micromonospora aurantiaca (nom. illeg.)]|uniref:hypothetical protein n=1 Tax=Micromonospora aurantiaca (nom. illeg.) TaxID=47850 RepID=UPI00340D413C